MTKTSPYTLQSIKGSDYALVATVSGNNRFVVTYAERKGRIQALSAEGRGTGRLLPLDYPLFDR